MIPTSFCWYLIHTNTLTKVTAVLGSQHGTTKQQETMKKLFVLSCLALAFSAQASAQRVQDFLSAQTRVGDGGAEIHVRPTIVDVRVDTTKQIVDSILIKPEDVNGLGGDVVNIRSWAAYQINQKHGCDVLMNATFLVRTDKESGGVKVNVTGWKGTFTNWHQATQADFAWLKYEKRWAKNKKDVSAPITAPIVTK